MARSRKGSADDVDGDLDTLSYRDAVDELEQILTELEDDDVDIDQLSRRVRRAASLIRLCQERIAGARLEVEHVVAELAAPTGPRADADAGAPPDGPDDDASDDDGPEDDEDEHGAGGGR